MPEGSRVSIVSLRLAIITPSPLMSSVLKKALHLLNA